jgi:dihydropteroate synthase
MLPLLASAAVPCVLMHWRGHSADMQARAVYGDVVADVVAELGGTLGRAAEAGVRPERVAVDPGLGFAKDADQNWTLLRRLPELHALGRPVLVGASRKAFLGRVLADAGGQPRPPDGRDAATAALSTLAAAQGAWCVRVHAVPASRDAVAVVARWGRG